MVIRRFRRVFRRRLCGQVIMLSLLLGALPAAGAGQPPPDTLDHFVYLPFIRSVNYGIHGIVTENGVPVAGIQLSLYNIQFDGGYEVEATVTDGNGRYSFLSVPTLLPGHRYVAGYENFSDPSRLGAWNTGYVSSYTAGTSVHMGDFDVANVGLGLPSSGTAITFPYTFTWTKRPASPTDNYRVAMADLTDFNPYVTTLPVGWVEQVETFSQPPGFSTGVYYYWWVQITRSDGSFGKSYWVNALCFVSCPGGAASAEGQRPLAEVTAVAGNEGLIGPSWQLATEWKGE